MSISKIFVDILTNIVDVCGYRSRFLKQIEDSKMLNQKSEVEIIDGIKMTI
jgi:hypothetical protein